jgi:uncharacterized MAPEG superfamily protein
MSWINKFEATADSEKQTATAATKDTKKSEPRGIMTSLETIETRDTLTDQHSFETIMNI